MHISELQKEICDDIQDRVKRLSRFVTESDVESLRQRKIIFDYLIARSDSTIKHRIKELDDIIHIVGYFTEQVPEFYRLSHSFAKNHAHLASDAFNEFSSEDLGVDIRNEIVLEKSEKISNAIQHSVNSYAAVANTEAFSQDFLAVFIPASIEIYDALISLITDANTDVRILKGIIFMHFEEIIPTLDLLRDD